MWGGGMEISSRRRVSHGDTFGVGDRAESVRQDPQVKATEEVQISGQTIRLGQLLKLCGLAESGGASKQLLAEGVLVNGVAEARRGRQLRDGDLVEAAGRRLRVLAAGETRA